jgi:hypothetical protein
MWNKIGEKLSLALMDAVRCSLARISKRNADTELWLQGAGFDVERVGQERL